MNPLTAHIPTALNCTEKVGCSTHKHQRGAAPSCVLQYNILHSLHCFIKLQKAGDNNTQPSLQDNGSLSCTASTSRWTWLRRSTWPTQQVPSFLAGFSSTNNIKTESHTDFKGQWPTPCKLVGKCHTGHEWTTDEMSHSQRAN